MATNEHKKPASLNEEHQVSKDVKLREEERKMDINTGVRSGEEHERTAKGVVKGEPGAAKEPKQDPENPENW